LAFSLLSEKEIHISYFSIFLLDIDFEMKPGIFFAFPKRLGRLERTLPEIMDLAVSADRLAEIFCGQLN